MKKFAILIMLVLYTVSSFGISITVHYCGGEWDHFSFGKVDNGPCKCGNGKMASDCCQDVVIGGLTFGEHTQSDIEAIDLFSKFEVVGCVSIHESSECYSKLSIEQQNWNIDSGPPPNKFESRLFISYRSIII